MSDFVYMEKDHGERRSYKNYYVITLVFKKAIHSCMKGIITKQKGN